MPRSFRAAANASQALRQHVKSGLHALRRTDRTRVRARQPRRITGSLSLDEALAGTHPNSPRWDYGVGYRPSKNAEDVVHWIEIHPATDGEVESVETKLIWLKQWIRDEAPVLGRMECRFIWVSSGRTCLTPTSPALRRLAAKGCLHVGATYRIE